MEKFYCYILWSTKSHKLNIGLTQDLEKRVSQIKADVSKWSEQYVGQWEQIWSKEFDDYKEARECEIQLNGKSSTDDLYALVGLSQDKYPVEESL